MTPLESNTSQTRLVNLFLELVRIPSPSRREGAVAKRLQHELASLGFAIVYDQAGTIVGGDTGNLIATLPPSDDTVDAEPLIFSCHMDTVTPCENVQPIVSEGVIRSDGNTILGGDDKGGIAAIIEGIRRLLEKKTPHGLIQVVFTVGEEVGLTGALNLDYSLMQAKRAYILDCGGPLGQLVVRGPAKDGITASIRGLTAHAGLSPEDGINAIQVAARAIDRMRLLRIDPETTANLGHIEGGGATNIVADHVAITAEARSLSNERLDEQSAHMRQCFEEAAREFGATATVTIQRDYHAFALSEDDPAVLHCTRAMRSLGLSPELIGTGGGSDCNIFNRHGITAIDLAIGMTDVHTCRESLRIDDLEISARLVEALATAGPLQGH